MEGKLYEDVINDFDYTELASFVILVLVTLTLTIFFCFDFLKLDGQDTALILGFITGIILYNTDYVDIVEHTTLNTWGFIIFLYPLVLTRLAYNMDATIMSKCVMQILIVQLAFIMYIFAFGFLVVMFASSKLNVLNVFTSGVLMTAIDVPSIILDIEKMKYIGELITAELIVGNAFTYTCFRICQGFYESLFSQWYQVVFVFLRYYVVAFVFGFCIGKVAAYCMRFMFNDVYNVIVYIFSIAYLSFIICEYCIFTNGVIGTFTILFFIVGEKTILSEEIDLQIKSFIDQTYYNAVPMFYYCMTTLLTIYTARVYRGFQVVEGLAVYITGVTVRLLTFLMISPIIGRLGYGSDFTSLITMFWVPKRGLLQIGMVFQAIDDGLLRILREKLITYALMQIMFTNVINAITVKPILKKIGLIESLYKKFYINNCLEIIDRRRIQNLAVAKMNHLLSDANWKIIYNLTQLTHTFKLTEEEEQEDIMWLKKEIYCPTCVQEVPYVPSKRDMSEMLRQVNLRVLKAERVSYVRQFQNGMIDKVAYIALMHAMEVALASSDLRIKLEELFLIFRERVSIFKHLQSDT